MGEGERRMDKAERERERDQPLFEFVLVVA